MNQLLVVLITFILESASHRAKALEVLIKTRKRPPQQIRWNLEARFIEKSVKFDEFMWEREKFYPRESFHFSK